MTKEELKKAIENAIKTITGKKDKTTAAVYGDVVTAGDTNGRQQTSPNSK